MSERVTKRHWFQFHLVTLVLMTVSLGVFVGLNVQERKRAGNRAAGWPAIAFERYMDLGKTFPDGRSDLYSGLPVDFYSGPPVYNANRWYTQGLALDATVAFVMLISLALISESLLRRREARKT